MRQHGQSIWLHFHGDIRKVAACRVKPYKLVNREETKTKETNTKKKVMLEDGLKDVENLLTHLDKVLLERSILKCLTL